ncbi:uncharacterized protein [Apostichopus japonicus]|uniref:uncharacterized protein isoform X2 n=1 Tax=Stichopus japonicus TaxID=307972 RepID=UPI003AB18FDD
MANTNTSVHTTIPRFTVQDGYQVWYMDVLDTGRLAVAGYRRTKKNTFTFIDLFMFKVDPDSQEKPLLLKSEPYFSQEFTEFGVARRSVCLLDDRLFLTCCKDTIALYDSSNGDLVKKGKFNGLAKCMTTRDGLVYVGLYASKEVIVLDVRELRKKKTITLKGLVGVDWPYDITVSHNKLFICTDCYRALMCNSEGEIEQEYTNTQYREAVSITVSEEKGLIFILWEDDGEGSQVVVYSLSGGRSSISGGHSSISGGHSSISGGHSSISGGHILASFKVPDDSFRIRINNNMNRLFLVTQTTGEVYEYHILNYPWLIVTLSVLLSKNDCHQLARHVALPKYQLDAIINSNLSAKDLLDILEESGVIHPSNVSRLLEAISVMKINETALFMLERYQRSRGDETSYGRFLAGLSSHLTLSLPRKLCDYFEFTSEKKKAVITSQTPGISFLLTLEDMGGINPFDVGKLVTPLKQYQLVQAVAKVQEYQTLVDERSELTKPIHTMEGKHALFIECLRKKTKSWYETMTPLPWKKSCKWKTSELFIACGLVLTDSKSKMKTTNVDPKCKLQYTDILTHERLKSATRIIIEGDPGSGKTMLSSQLAYDWSIGKISDTRMVVFLPLKYVDGMTIIEAIEQFYIPKGEPLNEDDIKAILDQASDENKICIVLDGLEEYNGRTKDGEPSEVERVMRKEKFPNCTVVLTSRSDFVHGLPQCPMLKLGRFGEEERDQYIANIIPDDNQKQQKVKCIIETSALLFDLCSNALLFVYIVHNIEHLGQIDKLKGQLDSVGPFMEVMVNTLLSLSRSEGSESEIMSTRLSEIAFNGLCKGYQQLMWPKSFLDEHVSNVKDWIESGILVVEEGETTREEKHQKKGEAVEERMVTQDEKISIDDERRQGQDDILSSHEESPRDRESSTDNKPNETEKLFTERKTNTDPQNFSLQVKFLHKVIQEWFAAKHFSSMLQQSKGKDSHQVFVNRHLPLINPADLHYVLRFTSYLCPENCYLIMAHLHSCYKSSKGVVPEYILNCIFLCFIECKSSVGRKKMENTVGQVCKSIVTIRGEDSRLLQQSKVSMLTYASNSEIRIGILKLVDLVGEVTKATLTFNSNIILECLPTLEVIEVSRWDMRLKEEDFEELIKFITNCKLLNKAFLIFPSPPPLLTDKKVLSSMKKNLTIEWIIGDRLVHTMDKKSGEWLMQFRSTPHQITDHVLCNSLGVMLMINKEGGRLDIPDTGVSLEIPSGALVGEQFIQMIIIPPHLESESLTFASNSSLVVELLPSNLNLLKPAKLTLPHCLVLKKGCEWKAKIYRSHHKEGNEPQWEEQSNTHYELGEHNCVIEIQRFSWEKIEILDKIVEAKNIVVYAAGRCGPTESMYLDIGYYWDLVTCVEVPKRNNASLLHEQPTVFKKDGKPLTISLEKFEPMNWNCSKGINPQVISFEKVAINKGTFCTFVLNRTEPKGTDTCTCLFKAGQAPNLEDYTFLLKAPDLSSAKQPSTSNRQEDERLERSTAGIEAPDCVVTTATLQNLSKNFRHEWLDVGRTLGITEATLSDIQSRTLPTQEKAYQMLVSWKSLKGEKATYKLAGEALKAAGRTDLYQQFIQRSDHHYEQRHGDNSQEGRRSIEEPIHQDERPSEVERTPGELHVESDGLSTSSDSGDQPIKIKHRNEDRARSSSKYHVEHKHLEDRERGRASGGMGRGQSINILKTERKRSSVGRGRGQSTSIMKSGERVSVGRGRGQSKISLTTETEGASVGGGRGQSTSTMKSRERVSVGRGRGQSKISLTTKTEGASVGGGRGQSTSTMKSRERVSVGRGRGQSKISLTTETEGASVGGGRGQSTSTMKSRERVSVGRGRGQSKISLTTKTEGASVGGGRGQSTSTMKSRERVSVGSGRTEEDKTKSA